MGRLIGTITALILVWLLPAAALAAAQAGPQAPTSTAAAPVSCLPIERPVFDRVAPDGSSLPAPVPRDTVTIGDVTMPSTAFSREVLAVLQLLGDLDLCVWAEIDELDGVRAIVDVMQSAGGLHARPRVDPGDLAAVDLAVLNGPRDTYIVVDLFGDPDPIGLPLDAWPDTLRLTWFGRNDGVTDTWFDFDVDGPPDAASTGLGVRVDARIQVLAISSRSIEFRNALAPADAPITLAIPAGSYVDPRLVAGAEGCGWFVIRTDGTVYLAGHDQALGPEWCGGAFPAVTPGPGSTDAPEVTMPPTDASGTTGGRPGSGFAPVALVLLVAAAAAVGWELHARRSRTA